MEKENQGPLVKTRGSNEEGAEITRGVIQESFFNHKSFLKEEGAKQLLKDEKEKNQGQLAVLDIVNEETMSLMERYGREPYRIPNENYHLIDSKKYQENFNPSTNATTSFETQGIFFKESENRNPLFFGRNAFHETLQLAAPLKFETLEYESKIYRQGISILTLEKDEKKYGVHEHFRGLQEAIVSRSEKKFAEKLIQHPLLRKQRLWLASEEFKTLRKEKSLEHNIGEEEIFWISKNGGKVDTVSYPKHQKVLTYVCQEIQKEFSYKYQDFEKVFEEFQKAHFTGKLFKIAKLTEKTFGEGSFRSLGDMDETEQSAGRKLEEFEKLKRLRNKKRDLF